MYKQLCRIFKGNFAEFLKAALQKLYRQLCRRFIDSFAEAL